MQGAIVLLGDVASEWRRIGVRLSDAALIGLHEMFAGVDVAGADLDLRSAALREFLSPELRRGLGVFLTPDEVVRAVVEVLAPTAADVICDPACGSGTFLLETLHLRKHGHNLGRIIGSDISPRMVLLVQLNLGGRALRRRARCPDDGGRTQAKTDGDPHHPPFGIYIERSQMRRYTKRAHGLASVEPLHPGIVIVVQRFRYDLGLYVHLHALVTDGCFAEPHHGTDVRFLPAAGLDTAALSEVLTALHRDLADESDEPPPVDDALAACVQFGLSAPGPVLTDDQPQPPQPMTVCRFGMQLHAASTVDGRDRKRLERVCRYLLRPPFAYDAIESLPDGRVRIHFSRPPRVGARFTTITRDTFLARLAALVPPPRFSTVRYYGVLAGRHHLRRLVVPQLDPQPQW